MKNYWDVFPCHSTPSSLLKRRGVKEYAHFQQDGCFVTQYVMEGVDRPVTSIDDRLPFLFTPVQDLLSTNRDKSYMQDVHDNLEMAYPLGSHLNLLTLPGGAGVFLNRDKVRIEYMGGTFEFSSNDKTLYEIFKAVFK